MKINKIIRKSRNYCEDRFVIKDNLFMVIDGATPLVNDHKKYKGSSASYFVSEIKKDILKNQDVFESLKNTSMRLHKEFKDEDLSPSAGISFIRIIDERVICSYMGDTEIFLRFKNGKYERIVDPDLGKLDAISLKEFAEKRPKYKDYKETIESIRPTLIKHRRLMNKSGGYSIFTPNPKGEFSFSEKVFDLNDIKEIYLYTDGFANAFTTLNLYKNIDDALTTNVDIKSIVKKIVKQSYKDKECRIFPRFKTIDDITAIQLIFD